MKLKIKKYVWAGIILIGIMLMSTFASALIQGLGMQQSEGESISLPSSNIIDYELTREQEVYAARLGKTVIKFEYSAACVDCLGQKAFVESIASQFAGQVILEEIAKDVDVPTLTATSYYGRKVLVNATGDEIIDAVCALLTDPPVFCTTKNI